MAQSFCLEDDRKPPATGSRRGQVPPSVTSEDEQKVSGDDRSGLDPIGHLRSKPPFKWQTLKEDVANPGYITFPPTVDRKKSVPIWVGKTVPNEESYITIHKPVGIWKRADVVSDYVMSFTRDLVELELSAKTLPARPPVPETEVLTQAEAKGYLETDDGVVKYKFDHVARIPAIDEAKAKYNGEYKDLLDKHQEVFAKWQAAPKGQNDRPGKKPVAPKKDPVGFRKFLSEVHRDAEAKIVEIRAELSRARPAIRYSDALVTTATPGRNSQIPAKFLDGINEDQLAAAVRLSIVEVFGTMFRLPPRPTESG